MHFFQKFFAVAEGATVAFARKVIPIWLDLLSSEEPKFQIIHRPEKPRPVIFPHYNLNSIAVATEGLTPLQRLKTFWKIWSAFCFVASMRFDLASL